MKKKFRFKKGDLVVCNRESFSKSYRLGDVYEVKRVYYDGITNRIKTVSDSHGSTENGWAEKYFESAIQSTLF